MTRSIIYETLESGIVVRAWRNECEIKFLDAYYESHAACPQCSETDLEQTCVGWFFGADTNSCYCECGWTGIVDDLVPKQTRETSPPAPDQGGADQSGPDQMPCAN